MIFLNLEDFDYYFFFFRTWITPAGSQPADQAASPASWPGSQSSQLARQAVQPAGQAANSWPAEQLLISKLRKSMKIRTKKYKKQ